MRICSGVVLLVSAFALTAVPAAGQSHLELSGARSVSTRNATGTFTTMFVPALLGGGTAIGGSGGQTLQLNGGRPGAFLAGLTWVTRDRWGLQVTASRSSLTFTGTNTPSHLALTYLARQPPSYEEQTFVYERSTDWPATTGAAALWQVGANACVRVRARRADLTLGGGLLWSRVLGHFDKASYVEFHLGGHSTIFYEEAIARLETDDGWHRGAGAFADLAVPLGGHLAVTAGVRWTPGPASVPVTVKILNADQMIFEIPVERVQQGIGTQPARFNRWGGPVVAFGLRVR